MKNKTRTYKVMSGEIILDDTRKTLTDSDGTVYPLTEPCLRCHEPNAGYYNGNYEQTYKCRNCDGTCGLMHGKISISANKLEKRVSQEEDRARRLYSR